MKIIICGAGQVGWQIGRFLSREENDVTIIDRNPDLVARATETLDVRGICGFASYPDVLEAAGAGEAGLLIAATHSDEVNMVTCQVAHSIFEVDKKIARLRAKSYREALYSDLYRKDHLPIDVVISPELEVAKAALGRLSVPSAFDSEEFFDGAAQLLGLRIDDDCPVVNTPLRELHDLFSTLAAMVIGIRRDRKISVPRGDDQIFAGDEIYIIAPNSDLDRTLEIFGKSRARCDRVVIVGGGNVGLGVAERLERQRVRTRIIEANREQAEFGADRLERTIVLHGDGVDPHLLEEARIGEADVVLCVTDDDRSNILAGVRAKEMGAKLSICLNNDQALESLMGPLGIDANINPRATTVNSILRHIRHGRIQSVHTIGDSEAEAIEAKVLDTSPIARKTLRELHMPGGMTVGGLLKDGKMVKISANTLIEPEDRIIVFAMADRVAEVETLLQVSYDYH